MAKNPFFYGVKNPKGALVPVENIEDEAFKDLEKYVFPGKQNSAGDKVEYYNAIFIADAQIDEAGPIHFTMVAHEVQIFFTDITMSAKEYRVYSDLLAEVLGGKVVQEIKVEGPINFSGKKFSKRTLGSLAQAFDYLAIREGKMAEFNDIYTENIEHIDKFNKEVDIQEVLEAFGFNVSGTIVNKKPDVFLDKVNNRLIDINPTRAIVGLPFDVVLSYNDNSPINAFKFINRHWNRDFVVGTEEVGVQTFFAGSLMGTRITGMQGMIVKDGCYYNHKFVKLTDFVIDAYAKIVREEEVSYLIKLTNTKNETTDFFEVGGLKGNSNFRNLITSKGAFHFYGLDDDIMMIHSQISQIDLPIVSSVTGYGFHKGKLFMRNGIYDTITKKAMFTADGDYCFADGQGYNVMAGNGFPITGTVPETYLPYLAVNPTRGKAEDYWKLFEGIYKDDMGIILLSYICAVLANGHFGSDKKFPYLWFSGVKGSGKSTASEIVRKVFGVGIHSKGDSAIVYSNTTPFAMTVYASSFSNIPVYFTEFQNDCRGAESKEKIMLAIYDGSGDLRGRADQTTQTYKFNCLPIVDGEEMSKRGAVRSRSVLVNVRKVNKNTNYVDFEKRFNSPLLQSLIYAYYEGMQDDEKQYDYYYAEAMESLMKADERTRENMALLYAATMLWFPEQKDRLLKLFNEYIGGQIVDQHASEGLNEVFSYMKKYMNNMLYSKIWYLDTDTLYLNMDNFFSHYHANINRSTKLLFDDDAYMRYIDDSPWKMEYRDVEDTYREYLKIPIDKDFPIQLLCIPGVYSKYQALVGKEKVGKLTPGF